MIGVLGLLLLGIGLLLSNPAFTKSNVIPKCTVVLAGYSTTIVCTCKSSGTIIWRHTSLDRHTRLVYVNGKTTSEYEARGFGERTLVISKVTTDMAGQYLCEILVDGRIVFTEETELIVLDPVTGLIANNIGLQRCDVSNFVEVIPSEMTMHHSVEPQGERENDTELSASELLMATQKSVLEKENEHWTPSTIGLLVLGVLPYVVFAGYLFIRMHRNRIVL